MSRKERAIRSFHFKKEKPEIDDVEQMLLSVKTASQLCLKLEEYYGVGGISEALVSFSEMMEKTGADFSVKKLDSVWNLRDLVASLGGSKEDVLSDELVFVLIPPNDSKAIPCLAYRSLQDRYHYPINRLYSDWHWLKWMPKMRTTTFTVMGGFDEEKLLSKSKIMVIITGTRYPLTVEIEGEVLHTRAKRELIGREYKFDVPVNKKTGEWKKWRVMAVEGVSLVEYDTNVLKMDKEEDYFYDE